MTEITRRNVFAIGAAAATTAVVAGGMEEAKAQAAVGAAPTLTLLLVNDIYKMGEEKGRGGFARLAAIVKAERAKPTPVYYAHAGDMFSPSLMSGFDQGEHTVELLNVAPPDMFVPGNHEFDFGKVNYFARVNQAKFPFFAANMRAADGSVLPKHSDRVITTLGGIKVGLFGLTLEYNPLMSKTEDLVFNKEMETARAQVKALKEEGAELLVCVGHTDFNRDLEIARSRLVDVMLSGHDHDLRVLFDGKTVMVESGEEGQFVTAIDLYCAVDTKDNKRTVSWWPSFRVIDSGSVTPDPEALAIVKKYESELSTQLDVQIGVLGVELDSRGATVRAQEAAIGNLIADAMKAATGADVTITNGGGIRGNKQYPVGHKVTRRDVFVELPFGNSTVMVEILGADIKAALENGVSQIDARAGRFPQVSGLKFEADAKAPVGGRILNVMVNGAPLDMAAKYKVATNNFLFSGGDGYASLGKGRTIIGLTDGKLLASEVMTYVRKLGTVEAKAEGRIVLK
jgi:5'-nucleotidase / UDP-sugar diphosphatase